VLLFLLLWIVGSLIVVGGCLSQPCSQDAAEKSRHRLVLGHYASSAQRSSVCPWNDRAITLLVVVSSVSVK
jgi:hypothetical protein